MMDSLITAALSARQNAHAPFSNFKVGAALEDASGRRVTLSIEALANAVSMSITVRASAADRPAGQLEHVLHVLHVLVAQLLKATSRFQVVIERW